MNATVDPKKIDVDAEHLPFAAPSRTSRTGGFLQKATGYGVLMAGIVVVSAFLPSEWSPMTWMGKAEAVLHNAFTYGSLEADMLKVAQTVRIQADQDIRKMAAQVLLEQRRAGLDPLNQLGGAADATCFLSQIGGALANSYNSRDGATFARNMASATCGVGREVRKSVAQEEMDVLREVNASSDVGIISAGAVSRGYDDQGMEKVWNYDKTLPASVRKELSQNIPSGDGAQYILADRVVAFNHAWAKR